LTLNDNRLLNEPQLAELYYENLKDLADVNVKKVSNQEENQRISNLFRTLPLISIFQTGTGYHKYGFNEVLPYEDFLTIMRKITGNLDLSDKLLTDVFDNLVKSSNRYFKNYVSEESADVVTDYTRENFIPESEVADVVVTRETPTAEALPTAEDLTKGETVSKLTFGEPIAKSTDEISSNPDTFAEDTAEFNNLVTMNDGVKPTSFDVQDRRWILNVEGLYDLVDKTTGEIYLKDVNMETGIQVYRPNVTPVDEARRANAIKYLNDNYKVLDVVFAEKGYDIKDIISKL
jgi:hypothetical protein